jgi:hypothetical protein
VIPIKRQCADGRQCKAAGRDSFLSKLSGERWRKQNDDDGETSSKHVDDAVEDIRNIGSGQVGRVAVND